MANEQAGFRNALMGFHKKDVLACIDRLSAENARAEQEAKEKIERLQQELADAETKGTQQETKLQESTAMVTNLVNQLQDEQKISADARAQAAALESQIEALKQQIATLEQQAEETGRRLFADEAENVRLKQEKATLQKQCEEVQAQLDDQTGRLAELKQVCETRLSEISTEHKSELDSVRREAEQEVQQAARAADVRCAAVQQEAASRIYAAEHAPHPVSQPSISGRGLSEVKNDLIQVGEYINGVDTELRRAMERLEQMLAQMDEPKPAEPRFRAAPPTKTFGWSTVPEKKPEAPVQHENVTQKTFGWSAVTEKKPPQKQERSYFSAPERKAAEPEKTQTAQRPPISVGGTFNRKQPILSSAAGAAEHLLDELQKMLSK